MYEDNNFIYPQFNNSLINVPHTVLDIFKVPHLKPSLKSYGYDNQNKFSKVVLFLADGLGYNLWQKEIKKNYLFHTIQKNNSVSKITTVFPSTTAAAITTIHSGLSPKEHGLLEWNLYMRELGAPIETIPYRKIPSKEPITEKADILFRNQTIYEILKNNNIQSFYFIPAKIQQTAFTQVMAKGSTIIPYVEITDLMSALHTLVETTQGNAYFYIYWGKIDTAEHTYGVESIQTSNEVALFSSALQHAFIEKLSKRTAADTALILTADHGQITIEPQQTTYINDNKLVMNLLKKDVYGNVMLPTGGARDIFLSVNENMIDETMLHLTKWLQEKASVIKVTEEITSKLFGKDQKHSEFSNRFGNILILPYNNQLVWYRYASDEIITEKGHHGGLTSDEMFIPFVFSSIENLQ